MRSSVVQNDVVYCRTNDNDGDNDDNDDGDDYYNHSIDTSLPTGMMAALRSERRGLLPLPPLSTTNHHSTGYERNQQRRRKKGRQRPLPPLSIQRKRHDARLRKLLQPPGDHNDDDNDDNDIWNGRRSDDWMRPYWLGLGLFLVLFSFWLLDTLKDPVFGALVGGQLSHHLPRAKLVSVGTTLALVVLLEHVAVAAAREQRSAHSTPHITTTTTTATTTTTCVQDDNDTTDIDDNVDIGKEGPATEIVVSPRQILDGGGTWTRMNIQTGYRMDATRFVSSLINNNNNDTNNSEDDRVPSHMFASIGIPYCIFFALMAYFLQFNPATAWTAGSSNSNNNNNMDNNHNHNVPNATETAWRVMGYCVYAAIESFGSLAVATFWSYTNSTLALTDAESYYGTIIAFAQMGAIAGSTMVTVHVWNSITLFVVASLVMLLHILVMTSYNRRFPPTTTIASTATTPTTSHVSTPMFKRDKATTQTEIADTWSGIHLILRHNYVLLILGASCLYEVSLTCLNYQMTLLGWSRFEETPDNTSMSFTQFMGHYGQMVNVSSLVLSSLIFPTMIRRVGLKSTLRLFPTLLFLANIIAFGALPGNLTVLFISMALLKAMTYSIHDPAKELLYIPTSNAIKFKAKFWIDVVGARCAKAIGSSINHFSGSVSRSIRVASTPSLLTAGALWYVCFCVGTQFDNLVQTGNVVGLDDDDDDDDNNVDGDIDEYYSRRTEFSAQDDEDGDDCGHVRETRASMELTAL